MRVQLEDGRKIYRVVQSGTSFGDSPLELHVGLGAAPKAVVVEVKWPDGRVQEFKGLPADRVYKIREGAAEPALVAFRPYKFRKDSGPHVH